MTADEERKERLERELHTHLEPGETLLWSGQPQAGFFLRPGELIAVPFLAFWGGGMTAFGLIFLGAFFVSPESLSPGAEWFILPLAPLMIAAGLHALGGRFFHDVSLRGRTLYGLTDRRLLILSGVRWRFCRERRLTRVTWRAKEAHRNGRTTIWFGPRPILYSLWGDDVRGPASGWLRSS